MPGDTTEPAELGSVLDAFADSGGILNQTYLVSKGITLIQNINPNSSFPTSQLNEENRSNLF